MGGPLLGGSLLVVLAVLLIGGRGGTERLSKPQYERTVQTAWSDVQTAFRSTDVPTRLLAPRIARAQRTLRRVADDLDALAPPKDVAAQNAALFVGLREYADELEQARLAAARGDRTGVEAFNVRAATSEAMERIAEAAEEMRFLGYDLGALRED